MWTVQRRPEQEDQFKRKGNVKEVSEVMTQNSIVFGSRDYDSVREAGKAAGRDFMAMKD